MMRSIAALALLVALAACGSTPGALTQPPIGPSTNAPLLPVGAADTCGAAPHLGLVGQPATALERVLIMRQVRLIRPDTAVTEDYRPERINFHIAPQPDGLGGSVERITGITCT